jgi:hypothetical protein
MVAGDEHVNGDAPGRPGDQGVDVEAADQVADVGRQRRQPRDRARHRGHVAGRRSPEAVQQPPRLQPVQQGARPGHVQWRHAEDPVGDQLHQHPSGPGHDQGPELRVTHHAQRKLGTGGDHGRHGHVGAERPRHRRIGRGQHVRVGDPEPDAAGVGLVRDAGGRGLQRDGPADPLGGRDGLMRAGRWQGGRYGNPVVGQQLERLARRQGRRVGQAPSPPPRDLRGDVRPLRGRAGAPVAEGEHVPHGRQAGPGALEHRHPGVS